MKLLSTALKELNCLDEFIVEYPSTTYYIKPEGTLGHYLSNCSWNFPKDPTIDWRDIYVKADTDIIVKNDMFNKHGNLIHSPIHIKLKAI